MVVVNFIVKEKIGRCVKLNFFLLNILGKIRPTYYLCSYSI